MRGCRENRTRRTDPPWTRYRGTALPVALAIALFSSSLALAASASPTRKRARSATTGHRFLELERRLGAGPAHLRVLDGLIAGARRVVSPRERYSRGEARQVLRAFGALLRQRGVREGSSLLLHRALEQGRADCDARAVLYVSFGEALGLPLEAARVRDTVPGHIVVRWRFGPRRALHWETLTGSEYRSPGAVVEPLSAAELLAIERYNLGVAWARRDDWGRALRSLDASLAGDGGEAVVHAVRAEVLLRSYVREDAAPAGGLREDTGSRMPGDGERDERLEQAAASLDRTLAIWPEYADALVTRSVVHEYRGDATRSRRDLRAALRIDRSNAAAHYHLGLSLFRSGRRARAISELSRAIRLTSRSQAPFERTLERHARLLRARAYEAGADGGGERRTARIIGRAAADLDAVLADDPANREALETLARIALSESGLRARPSTRVRRQGGTGIQASRKR